MAEQSILEGLISISAALEAQSRAIHTLYVRRGHSDDRVMRLVARAEEAAIAVQLVEPEVIQSLAGGKTHGGVIAAVGERRMVGLGELLRGKHCPAVVMLDGIEDPYNFGEAVRSLYAAGIDGVVVRPRNWLSAAGIVARASAGASELMPMAVADTAQAAASVYRDQGMTIACAVKRDAVSLHEANLTVPLFLLIGGEKRGITRALVDGADLLLQIPYGRRFAGSLGTAAAAAVIGFEILRQRLRAATPGV